MGFVFDGGFVFILYKKFRLSITAMFSQTSHYLSWNGHIILSPHLPLVHIYHMFYLIPGDGFGQPTRSQQSRAISRRINVSIQVYFIISDW
jgi:hypothetical protein